MFRNVFMGCLVVFSKRSYLGSCTLDHRATVCTPNLGQRVADYYTRMPKSAGWSFLLRGAGLVSIDVCDPMPGLPVGQCVSWSSIVPVPMFLSAAGSLRPDLLLHTPKQHLPSEEDSCRKHVGTHPLSLIFDALAWVTASQSSSESVHVCASGPSCVIL